MKEVRKGRNFDEILQFARECKKLGNEFYNSLDYDGAVNQYERCLSLFNWVEPTDPDWKNKVLYCIRFTFLQFVSLYFTLKHEM